MSDEPREHAGVTLTREQIDTVVRVVKEVGVARLRAHRFDFDETEYLIGAATAIQAVTDGTFNQIPGLVMHMLSGRSVIDPDGSIKESLGMRECIYCGKQATTEIEGDPLCDTCHEEI
jgi:hypothetical protein